MGGIVHDPGIIIPTGGKVEYVTWVVSQVSQKCLERSIFCDCLRRILHARVVIISVRTEAAGTDTIVITILVQACKGTFAEARLGTGRDCKQYEDKNFLFGHLVTPENDRVK